MNYYCSRIKSLLSKKKIVFSLICFILIASMPLSSESEGRGSTARGLAVYAGIKTLYNKWDLGLFGSRKYYRGRLYRHLVDAIGRDIVTDYDYILPMPDSLIKKSIVSDLGHGKWLHIHGHLNKDDVKKLIGQGTRYVRDLERRKYLFSLSGRIKSFRLQEAVGKRWIHLYLDRVGIRASAEK